MTMTGDPGRRGLVARVQGILLRPTAEWHVIDAEPATTQSLFTGYVMILAAIGPVCGLIGGFLFLGPTFARIGLPLPVAGLVISAILNYVLALVGTYVFGLVINALAPTFGGAKDPTKAMKVAAYTGTAGWIAGVFGLIPFLAFIVLIGVLYNVFVLYRGLPILMRAPQDKAVGYTAVVVLIMLGVWIVLGLIGAGVSFATGASPGMGAFMHPHTTAVTTTTSY